MAEEIIKDCKCGYCGSEFKLMATPKILPCQHIHCLSCLQENYEHHNKTYTTCPDCQ